MWCNCLDRSKRRFDSINRIATCIICGNEVKDWYGKPKEKVIPTEKQRDEYKRYYEKNKFDLVTI